MSSMNFHFVAYKLKNEGSCLVISIDIFLQMILKQCVHFKAFVWDYAWHVNEFLFKRVH